MRIIGGRWKRSVLPVIDAPGLRPTPDRVRETLFNWLAHAYGGAFDGRSAIDLFAGSGALGFEAASRGAAPVVLVEQHAQALGALAQARAKLDTAGIEIEAGDALRIGRRLAERGRRFDMVFVDPPFGAMLLDDAVEVARALCAPDGYIYIEAANPVPGAMLAATGLAIYRADRAGDVFYHLLQRKIIEEETSC